MMEYFELFGTLIMLVFLQVVLGFDNLLYIALEAKKAPENKQESVTKVGISIAIILRIILLFCLINLIESFKNPFFKIDSSLISLEINLHSVIVLVGGGFILYTAIKEIWHMIVY